MMHNQLEISLVSKSGLLSFFKWVTPVLLAQEGYISIMKTLKVPRVAKVTYFPLWSESLRDRCQVRRNGRDLAIVMRPES